MQERTMWRARRVMETWMTPEMAFVMPSEKLGLHGML
jgi:hypothetical protein